MPDVKRTLKIKTQQQTNEAKESPQAGFPMRDWSVQIWCVHETDHTLVPAAMYEKCVYKLHPSFDSRAKQTFREPPFICKEEGWGEFEMLITLSAAGKGNEHTLPHDLNFAQEEYEAEHRVTFKNPKPELLNILRQSGPVPGDAHGIAPSKAGAAKKKGKASNVDMDKLADCLTRLTEDDLLYVVQIIHEQKTSDVYTKNDVENGEFHVDLYTLTDNLIKELWDFASTRATPA